MSDIKISSIILKMNGEEVELSVDAAKDLKRLLNELFPEKEYIPFYPPQPYQPLQPYYPTEPFFKWSITSSEEEK